MSCVDAPAPRRAGTHLTGRVGPVRRFTAYHISSHIKIGKSNKYIISELYDLPGEVDIIYVHSIRREVP